MGVYATDCKIKSPSSRRAWVEISLKRSRVFRQTVALLAEGVGRNADLPGLAGFGQVALLAEGVGRNWTNDRLEPKTCASPSSRRAWVEIQNLSPAVP